VTVIVTAFGQALAIDTRGRRLAVVSQYTPHGFPPFRPNVVGLAASLLRAHRIRDEMTYADDIGRGEAVVIDVATGERVG
jgi:hypothetical protein